MFTNNDVTEDETDNEVSIRYFGHWRNLAWDTGGIESTAVTYICLPMYIPLIVFEPKSVIFHAERR